MRFTLTMTRADGRQLTEELDARRKVRDLVATVLGVLTFRPDYEFLDFATEVVVRERPATHPETGMTFELTENKES